MPKVVLELEITSSGETKIQTVAGSLDKLGTTAATAEGRTSLLVDAFGRPMESAAASAKKLGDTATDVAGGVSKLGAAGQAAQGAFQGLAQEGAGLLGRFGGLLLALGPVGLGIGATAYAAHTAIDAFTGFAKQVRDLSYLSGGSAKDVSVLVSGLEAFGVSSETVELGVAKMSAAIEAGSPAVNRLGISTRTTSGQLKDGLTMFYETVDALGRMTNEVERNALAREIFGRGWTSIMPILRMGSQAIRQMGEESGKAVTEADKERMRAYTLAVHELYEIFERIQISFGAGIVIPVTAVLKWVTSAGGDKGWTPSAASLEEAQRKAFPGLSSSKTPLAAGLSETALSAAAAVEIGAGSRAYVAPETPAEMETRLKLKTQLASLDVAALTASAWSEEDRLSAAIARVNAERQKTLDLIALEYKGGKLGPEGTVKALADKANLEAGVNRAADAENERQRIESALKIGQERIKVFDTEEARAIKAAQTEIGLWRSIAEASLLGDAAKLAAVDKWQQDNLLAIATVYGEEQQGQALITAVYAEAERRRAQIRIDTALEAEQRVAKGVLATQGQISDAAEQAESHLVDVTEWSTEERRKWRAQDFLNVKKNYDDEVTEAINVELQKLDIYKDQGRKQLDIVVGVYDAIEARRQKDIDNQKKALLMQMGASDDYFDKVGLALEYHATDHRNADQRILDITRETYTNMSRSASDLYFDAMMGQLKTFGDYWKSFWSSMARSMSDEMSKATMSWLFGGGGGTSGGGTQAGAIASMLGLPAGSSSELVSAELAALAKAGGGGLLGGAGGASGGGGTGLLGGVTNAIGGLQKLYGLVTGAAEGGWAGALDGLIGITKLSNALTGGNAAVGTFGGLYGGSSIYSGVSAATMAELSGAAGVGTAAAAGGSMYGGLSAATMAELSGAGAGAGAAGAGAAGAGAAGFGAAGAFSTYLPALAPLAIGLFGIMQSQSGSSADQLAQRWGNTAYATLHNYGSLEAAVAYAQSDGPYALEYASQLRELQTLRANGPQSQQDQLRLAALASLDPGWASRGDWNFSLPQRLAYTPPTAAFTYDSGAANQPAAVPSYVSTDDYAQRLAAYTASLYEIATVGSPVFSGPMMEGRASGGPIEAGIAYIGHGPSPEPFVSARPGYVLTHQEARDIYRDAASAQGGGSRDTGSSADLLAELRKIGRSLERIERTRHTWN